jgi:hypothetical protein
MHASSSADAAMSAAVEPIDLCVCRSRDAGAGGRFWCERETRAMSCALRGGWAGLIWGFLASPTTTPTVFFFLFFRKRYIGRNMAPEKLYSQIIASEIGTVCFSWRPCLEYMMESVYMQLYDRPYTHT